MVATHPTTHPSRKATAMAEKKFSVYAALNIPGPCVVTRDGKEVSPVLDNGDAAWTWILRHQGQSVEYALRYGGYSVKRVDLSTPNGA